MSHPNVTGYGTRHMCRHIKLPGIPRGLKAEAEIAVCPPVWWCSYNTSGGLAVVNCYLDRVSLLL